MARPEITVLIVEDDQEWATALQRFYEEKLEDDVVVRATIARTYEEAQKKLRNKWDLLSLDIDLRGQSGLVLVETAGIRRLVKGVICLSGIMDDPGRAKKVMPSEKKRRQLRHFPETVLEKNFGSRQKMFRKEADISLTIADMREFLNTKELIGWITGSAVLPPYEVESLLNENPAQFVVKSISTGKMCTIVDKQDVAFLASLVELAPEGKPLTFAETLEIYDGPSAGDSGIAAGSRVTTTTRRLMRLGLDPKALFKRRTGEGWVLIASVRKSWIRRRTQGDFPGIKNDKAVDPKSQLDD